jgi:hypothetical protein
MSGLVGQSLLIAKEDGSMVVYGRSINHRASPDDAGYTNSDVGLASHSDILLT